MKRPEGFDAKRGPEPNSRSNSKLARSSAPKVERKLAPEPKLQRPAKASSNSIPKVSTTTRGEPRRTRVDARRAARDRRRFERSEIRRFTHQSRRRRWGWVAVVGVLAVLGSLLAVAVYSPLLALRTITITGTSAVSAEDVSDAIDGQLGTPLALLDLDQIRSSLNKFPLIRSFVTEIIPPSTLVVHVVERVPVGVVATSSGFVMVDPAGVALSSSATRTTGVPLIDVGASGTESVSFTAVVGVLLSLPEAVRSRVDIARATSKDDVRLVLAGAGQRVVWGSAERSALKARVLQELLEVQGKNAKVEYDVSAPLSPVVRPK